VGLDQRGQAGVTCDGSNVKGSLALTIQNLYVSAAKQEHTSTTFLIIESSNMKRSVAVKILAVHVCPVKQQMFQVCN
jgi:hypothetical protein